MSVCSSSHAFSGVLQRPTQLPAHFATHTLLAASLSKNHHGRNGWLRNMPYLGTSTVRLFLYSVSFSSCRTAVAVALSGNGCVFGRTTDGPNMSGAFVRFLKKERQYVLVGIDRLNLLQPTPAALTGDDLRSCG
jgi:hypothetical protein